MGGQYFFLCQSLGLLVYGGLLVLVLAAVANARRWPTWKTLVVLYLAMAAYFGVCGVLGFAVVEQRDWAWWFLAIDTAAVVYFCLHAWNEWKNHHQDRRAPRSFGSIVLVLSHRLAIGDA